MSRDRRPFRNDGFKIERIEWFDDHGKYHREDGPALVDLRENEFWYKHGLLHREDGPAVFIQETNKCYYFLNGVAVTEADLERQKTIDMRELEEKLLEKFRK